MPGWGGGDAGPRIVSLSKTLAPIIPRKCCICPDMRIVDWEVKPQKKQRLCERLPFVFPTRFHTNWAVQ